MKVKVEDVHFAYDIAKRCYNKQISFTYSAEIISKRTGMAISSAKDYVYNFRRMMQGERYTRLLNRYATEYYIKQIRKDFGETAYQMAILATKKECRIL